MNNSPSPPEEAAVPRDGGASDPAAPIVLDGVRDEDLPTLSQWMNNTSDLHLWTTRRRPILYEDLEDDIRKRCREGLFTVMRDTESQGLVGFVDGALRERHGIVEVEVYVPNEWQLRGGMWGLTRFFSHLFNSYPLRKIYCQTYAYNRKVVHILEAFGSVREGCFKEFTWWQDRYWDMFVYSYSRETFEAVQRGEGRLGRLQRLAGRLGRWPE